MENYVEFLKSKLEALNNVESVSIENNNELHFVACNSDIIIRVNCESETYTYTSGGDDELRSAIDEALRNQ